jgi:hypothetical protein
MFFVAVWGSFGDLRALDMSSKRRKMLQQNWVLVSSCCVRISCENWAEVKRNWV